MRYAVVLAGQYRLALRTEKKAEGPPIAEKIARRIDEQDQLLTWEDIYVLEHAIVSIESHAALKRRAWIVRAEYAEIASESERSAYAASSAPDIDSATEEALRTDLLQLTEEIHWRYVALWAFDDLLQQLMTRVAWVGAAGVVLIAPTLGLLARKIFHLNPLLVGIVVAAGVAGGLVSTMRRLQTAELTSNVDLDAARLDKGSWGVMLSPLLGGAFALLLSCMIGAGYLEGSKLGDAVLPKLTHEMLCGPLDCSSWDGDLARLLVWSFIAGFAEKFVPDRLATLSGAEKS